MLDTVMTVFFIIAFFSVCIMVYKMKIQPESCPQCNKNTLEPATYSNDGHCSECKYSENVSQYHSRKEEETYLCAK